MHTDSESIYQALLRQLTAHAALACQTSLAWLRMRAPASGAQWYTHAVGSAQIDSAFVAHVEGCDDLLHVADAQQDPRFAADPLVSGDARIRLVASLPLLSPNGARLGTLCVADPRTHGLSPDQIESLRAIAAMIGRAAALAGGASAGAERASEIAVVAAASPGASRHDACSRCAECLPRGLAPEFTQQTAVRAAVQRQTEVLRMVTEAIPATVVVVGADGRYHFANSAFERYAGLPSGEILGRTAIEVLGEAEVARRRPWMRRALSGETVTFTLDYPSMGGPQYIHFTCIPLRMDGGEVDGFVGIGQDVTQQRREQDRLADQARLDPLTGLLNRLAFEQQIEHQVRQGRGEQLGLLYIDLDFFKPVNDNHGHAAGDSVLEQFGQRLKSLVRPTDAVGRLGGDEFAILLLGVREAANATMVAHKIVAAARQPFQTRAGTISVGASVGVAFGVNAELGWRELIGRADAQLYQAKARGRGTAC